MEGFVKFDDIFNAYPATSQFTPHMFIKSRMLRFYMFQARFINVAFVVSKS